MHASCKTSLQSGHWTHEGSLFLANDMSSKQIVHLHSIVKFRACYLLTVLVISLPWHTTIASTLSRRPAPLSRGGARVRRA